MFDVFGDLNWLAIMLATVMYYMMGGLWFSQLVFGKAWEKSIGFDRPKEWKESTIFYVGPLIGCLVTSIATAILIYSLNIQSLADSVRLGLTVGLGYAGAVSITNAITPTAPQPLVHGLITGAYHVLGIIIVSAVLFSLR